MAMRYPFRCKSASSTTGTGTYTLSEPTSAGWRNLTRAVVDGDLADGDTVAYIVVDTTVTGGPKLCEVGTGVWNNTAKTLTRATVIQPNGAAVSWGAGTRDVYIVDSPTLLLAAANNLSDLASAATARTNLGLGSAAVLTAGVAANNAVQLNGSAQLPAVDASLLTGLKKRIMTRVTADVNIASATLANVTGLVTPALTTGLTYGFVARLFLHESSTGGYKAAMAGTLTATAVFYRGGLIVESALSFLATGFANAMATTILQVASAGVEDSYAEIVGTVTVNAGGTLAVQMAQNVATGTLTVKRGSTLEWQEI